MYDFSKDTMIELIQIAISILPVFVFLVVLIVLDSYKLTRPLSIILVLLYGCWAALLSFFVNNYIFRLLNIDTLLYSRYVSPVVEEVFKALPFFYLLKFKKIGFLVDGAIFGFAVGTGFAFVENLFYLQTLENQNVLLWIIRGFGTAVMHGGATAIFVVFVKTWLDRTAADKYYYYLCGLLIAIVIHSIFNHFILPAVITTLLQLILLPLIFVLIYNKSEYILREWLAFGMDVDVWLLEQINTGQFSSTKPGNYLSILKDKFPGTVIADMLCYLRLHLELAIRAKGVLLMQEAGFSAGDDPQLREKITEMQYLEKTIGKTGKLALTPLIHPSAQDLWQLKIIRNWRRK
jgi:RsiW-degrading membrane proteinase PrsW (M82 family)